MSDDDVLRYSHSGRIGPLGPILAVLFAVLLALPLGLAYAFLIKLCPFVYLNVIGTVVLGGIFGYLSGRAMIIGPVRNNTMALACGAVAGILALYGAWVGHVYVITRHFTDSAVWTLNPALLWSIIKDINQSGTWTIAGDDPVNGFMLWVVWLVEAGIIIGAAAVVSRMAIAKLPFCEQALCWLKDSESIDTLEVIVDPEAEAALARGDLSPLASIGPRVANAPAWTRLFLRSSPKTDMRTVCVQRVALVDNDGKTEENVSDLSDPLVVPTAMYDLIKGFADLPPAEPEPEPASEPASEPEPD